MNSAKDTRWSLESTAEELWKNEDPVLHGIKEAMGLNLADHAVVVSGIRFRDPATFKC